MRRCRLNKCQRFDGRETQTLHMMASTADTAGMPGVTWQILWFFWTKRFRNCLDSELKEQKECVIAKPKKGFLYDIISQRCFFNLKTLTAHNTTLRPNASFTHLLYLNMEFLVLLFLSLFFFFKKNNVETFWLSEKSWWSKAESRK